MEGEPELPAPSAEAKFFNHDQGRSININPDSINLSRSFNTTSTFNSSASSSSYSPPDFVRDIQATFKRHRPVGIVCFLLLLMCVAVARGFKHARIELGDHELGKIRNRMRKKMGIFSCSLYLTVFPCSNDLEFWILLTVDG